MRRYFEKSNVKATVTRKSSYRSVASCDYQGAKKVFGLLIVMGIYPTPPYHVFGRQI